jgi:hypothetical protein
MKNASHRAKIERKFPASANPGGRNPHKIYDFVKPHEKWLPHATLD